MYAYYTNAEAVFMRSTSNSQQQEKKKGERSVKNVRRKHKQR
jgi:hypothetical protein